MGTKDWTSGINLLGFETIYKNMLGVLVWLAVEFHGFMEADCLNSPLN